MRVLLFFPVLAITAAVVFSQPFMERTRMPHTVIFAASGDAAYEAQMAGRTAYIGRDGSLAYSVTNGSLLGLKLLGAGKALAYCAEEPAGSVRNSYVGALAGVRSVQGFKTVRFREVYPRTDLLYRARENGIEYEFDLAPGADPREIRFAATRTAGLKLVDGDLVVSLDQGEMRHHAPIAFQYLRSGKRLVDVAFELRGAAVGFRIGRYDVDYPLIIDPVITYSTYLGGTGADNSRAVATDAAGNIYIAGETGSSDFPSRTTSSSYAQQHVFVTKMRSDGSIAYTTILASSGRDTGAGIAVGVGGDVFIAGSTTGTDFPTSSTAYRKTAGGQGDAFVTHLNVNGAILYSTYLGGSATDTATGIAIDGSGNAFVTGSTASYDFPVLGPVSQFNHGGYADAFLTKVNPTGTSLMYSTLVGGSGLDIANGVSVGPVNVCIGGLTQSTDMVTFSAFQPAAGGLGDGFIACLRNDGAAWSVITYFGVLGYDDITGIAQDSGNNIYVTGTTLTSTFPVTAGAFQASASGDRDIFVAKFSPAATQLIYSTLIGGGGLDASTGIAVDSLNQVWITGLTYSINFPVVKADYAQAMGGSDAFVSELNATGTQLLLSTRYGGGNDDRGNGIALAANGDAIFVGSTSSTNLSGAFASVRPTLRGQSDGFVGRIHIAPIVVTYSISGVATFGGAPLSGVLITLVGPVSLSVTTSASGGYTFASLPAGGSYSVAPFLVGYRFNPIRQAFSNLAANQIGNFTAATAVYPGDFDGNGVPDLIWQNDTTWQIGTWLLGGPQATSVIGYTYPLGAIDPNWSLVTVADFNGDGVLDIVWMNTVTRMVAVWYMTGPQGTVQASSAVLGVNPGWKLVSCADIDGNGVPDLIWQKDSTRAVTVWYMGGAAGASLLGTAVLAPGTYPGWSVVGVADFNRDGVQDLVWQDDLNRTVSVWYMGGPQGTSLLSGNYPAPGNYPGWKVMAVVDLDRDGVPDLIWQADSTRQVSAWYMGGPLGIAQKATAFLAPGNYPGWRVTSAK